MEEFQYIGTYETKQYDDSKIFKIDVSTKKIEAVKEQPLVVGEENSQLIRFEIERFVDGIDLSETTIHIIFVNEIGNGDASKAINVECSNDTLRFGWLVPGIALVRPGILTVAINFESERYMLRTRTIDLEVFDTVLENYIPEPEDKE